MKTTDSGSSLSMKDFDIFKLQAEYGANPSYRDKTVLIAPDKKTQKLWIERYPGIEVLLSQKLYTIPKDLRTLPPNNN